MPSRASWRAGLSLLLLIVITTWSAFLFVGDDKLHVYFFDVGQGDAILIRKGTFQILVDGGPDETVLDHLGRTLPPWDRTIELVVLTHPHADHVTGLLEVLRRYEIGEVWGTGVIHPTQVYVSFLTEIRNRQIPYRAVKAGDSHAIEDIKITILYPLQSLVGARLDNANASSIVVKVVAGKFSALLTGDLEEEGQQTLVENDTDLAATVLKIPHQGSRDADLPQFLQRAAPPIAILSVGKKNQYGHPHADVIQRYEKMGITVLRTDRDGTIHLSVTDNILWIKTDEAGTMARVELVQ